MEEPETGREGGGKETAGTDHFPHSLSPALRSQAESGQAGHNLLTAFSSFNILPTFVNPSTTLLASAFLLETETVDQLES